MERTPGDVGGWFRTARDGPVALPATPTHVGPPRVSWTADGKALAIKDTSVVPAAIALVSVDTGAKTTVTAPPANPGGVRAVRSSTAEVIRS